MNIRKSIICYFFFFFCLSTNGYNQGRADEIGLIVGMGDQSVFPFGNDVYALKTKFLKGQLGFTLKDYGQSTLVLLLEPSYYRTNHQLLDPDFVQDNYGDDYLEQRRIYTQKKAFNEFSFNLGIMYRFPLYRQLHGSVLISVGPSFHDTATERLAEGFAFSDVGSIGVSWINDRLMLHLRLSVRHVSNANFKFPNSGHNSSNLEIGFSVPLDKS